MRISKTGSAAVVLFWLFTLLMVLAPHVAFMSLIVVGAFLFSVVIYFMFQFDGY